MGLRDLSCFVASALIDRLRREVFILLARGVRVEETTKAHRETRQIHTFYQPLHYS